MSEFNTFFGKVTKKVNRIVDKKKKKYPMLDIEKIRRFLLTWTKHYMEKNEKLNLKMALYHAIIVFETSCNLAIDKLNKEK